MQLLCQYVLIYSFIVFEKVLSNYCLSCIDHQTINVRTAFYELQLPEIPDLPPCRSGMQQQIFCNHSCLHSKLVNRTSSESYDFYYCSTGLVRGYQTVDYNYRFTRATSQPDLEYQFEFCEENNCFASNSTGSWKPTVTPPPSTSEKSEIEKMIEASQWEWETGRHSKGNNTQTVTASNSTGSWKPTVTPPPSTSTQESEFEKMIDAYDRKWETSHNSKGDNTQTVTASNSTASWKPTATPPPSTSTQESGIEKIVNGSERDTGDNSKSDNPHSATGWVWLCIVPLCVLAATSAFVLYRRFSRHPESLPSVNDQVEFQQVLPLSPRLQLPLVVRNAIPGNLCGAGPSDEQVLLEQEEHQHSPDSRDELSPIRESYEVEDVSHSASQNFNV